MRESVEIIKQVLNMLETGPIKYYHKNLAPSRLEAKTSMEGVIHHFKYFTENLRIPTGETYTATEAPKGEFGVYLISNNTEMPYRCKIKAPGF